MQARIGQLRGDRRGTIAVVTALSITMLVVVIGAGIDLMRAYGDEQKLTEVTALACQYATRPSVILTATQNYAGSGSLATYQGYVTTFITNELHTQFPSTSPSYSLTPTFNGTPQSLSTVSLSSSTPTNLIRIIGVKSIPIAATSQCYPNSTALPQVNVNNALVSESFTGKTSLNASVAGGTTYITPSGAQGAVNGNPNNIPTSNTFPSAPGYTGATQASWYIMGHCLEIDIPGNINTTIPLSTTQSPVNSAELDCDNGAGSAGNSSISTQIYLEAGNYELRYFYASRIDYPDYDPVPICGSSAADLAWANDYNVYSATGSNWIGSAVMDGKDTGQPDDFRSNQINVYLDLSNTTTGQPPTHTTLDGTQTLAGSNLIDECVYTPPNGAHGGGLQDNPAWVQRSVRIYAYTPGFYWLSFAADGHSDSFGGQIADIYFCQGTCQITTSNNTPVPLQDNFPSAAYNPYYPGGSLAGAYSSTYCGGTTTPALPSWANLKLFEDTFQSPAYTSATATAGNLTNSLGTSGAASGWPCLAASGWAVSPANQMTYLLGSSNTPGGVAQDVVMAGATAVNSTTTRMISRPFLLVPGYYNLSYYYFENFIFTNPASLGTQTYCGATPSAATLPAGTFNASNGYAAGTIRNVATILNEPLTVDTVGVFISDGQLVSTPLNGVTSGSSTDGPATLGTTNATEGATATATYSNPVLPTPSNANTVTAVTASTTQTVAPDAINLTSYTASKSSALLDICGYATTYTKRSVNFEIQKTAQYWLTFSSNMDTANTSGTGGSIYDPVLTALGSPNMSGAPSNPVVVPTGTTTQNPAQPGQALAALDGSGTFYIIADPLIPPAPQQ